MIIMNPLYPPVLGDFFNIWGTPHSTGSGQAPMPPAGSALGGLHLREGHGGRGRVDSSLIESGTGSAGMTYEARAQCTVPLRARGTRFFAKAQNDIWRVALVYACQYPSCDVIIFVAVDFADGGLN